MWRYLVPLGIFAVLVAFLSVGLDRDPRLVPSPLIGKPAPAFSVPRLYRPKEKISPADYKGKVWLLNVWASWCVSCRIEHPFLVQLSKNGNIVPVVGLNYKDQRMDALQWLHDGGDPYKAIAFDADGRVGIDWGVYGVPETFVMDKQGIIRYKHTGPISPADWQQIFLPLIKKLETPPESRT